MNDKTGDLNSNDNQFIEKWTFKINISDFNGDPKNTNQNYLNAMDIRNMLLGHMKYPNRDEVRRFEPKSISDLHLIQTTIKEIIDDRLSDPDFECYLIDYHEDEGSLEVAFTVLLIMYGGIAGYGSFRSGLDYIRKDLKSLFGIIKRFPVKVRRKFIERKKL